MKPGNRSPRSRRRIEKPRQRERRKRARRWDGVARLGDLLERYGVASFGDLIALPAFQEMGPRRWSAEP